MHDLIKGPFPLRAWKRLFFVCFIDFFLFCLALAAILNAERSIEETKNALFHARSGNEPQELLKGNSTWEAMVT